MYEPSENFYANVIQKQVRRIAWGGEITDTNGTVYPFSAANISAKTKSTIVNEIAESEMSIGTVFSSELNIGLYLDDIGISRTLLYGGEISISCTITYGQTTGTVPMGVFKIVEATQSGEICSIVAYDHMTNFDKEFPIISGANTAYEWAVQFCEDCGVALGTTMADFQSFPNGGLVMTLVWSDDIKTYRDALSYLSAAIGCSAHIGRDGLLYFNPLNNKSPVATIRANDRFASDITHTEWSVNSVCVINSESGNVTKQGGGSLLLDLEENPYLQDSASMRNLEWEIVGMVTVPEMLQNILTSAGTVSAVPIEADIPLDPCLDLYDIVTLTGGQANNTKVLITAIEHTVNGATTIRCAGANTTDESGGSSGKSGNRDTIVWLTSGMSSDANIDTALITWGDLSAKTWGDMVEYKWGDFLGGGQEVTIAEAELFPRREHNKGVISFTVNFALTADAAITYRLYRENRENFLIWEVTETQKAGQIAKTITSPLTIWSREAETYTLRATMAGVDT